MTPGSLLLHLKRFHNDGVGAFYFTRYVAPRILDKPIGRSLKRDENGEDLPAIHSLISTHDWLLSLWMLASWFRTTRREWEVILHEDGSLGVNEVSAIRETLPNVTIVRRPAADVSMARKLADYPRCADYRSRMPHGLKCFDVPHFARQEKFLLIDPDVLFFRRPEQILEWCDDRSARSCWFNEDPQEPSPLSPDQCQRDLKFNLWQRVNSGLCLVHKSMIDFGHFEKWLGLPAIKNGIAWRTEQTLFALGASRYGKGGLLPKCYEVSLAKTGNPDAIARHYVGAVRNRFYAEGIRRLKRQLLA